MKTHLTRGLAILLIAITAWQTALAQNNRKISGTVVDENGSPMAGATLVVAGTDRYAITESDGKFSLTAQTGDNVTISYFGYDDIVLTVDDRESYEIGMQPSEATLLEETVVIG